MGLARLAARRSGPHTSWSLTSDRHARGPLGTITMCAARFGRAGPGGEASTPAHDRGGSGPGQGTATLTLRSTTSGPCAGVHANRPRARWTAPGRRRSLAGPVRTRRDRRRGAATLADPWGRSRCVRRGSGTPARRARRRGEHSCTRPGRIRPGTGNRDAHAPLDDLRLCAGVHADRSARCYHPARRPTPRGRAGPVPTRRDRCRGPATLRGPLGTITMCAAGFGPARRRGVHSCTRPGRIGPGTGRRHAHAPSAGRRSCAGVHVDRPAPPAFPRAGGQRARYERRRASRPSRTTGHSAARIEK